MPMVHLGYTMADYGTFTCTMARHNHTLFLIKTNTCGFQYYIILLYDHCSKYCQLLDYGS